MTSKYNSVVFILLCHGYLYMIFGFLNPSKKKPHAYDMRLFVIGFFHNVVFSRFICGIPVYF